MERTCKACRYAAKIELEKLEKKLRIVNYIETRGKKIDNVFHVLGLKRQIGYGKILKDFQNEKVVEFLGPLFKMRDGEIRKVFEEYFHASRRNFFLCRIPHVSRINSQKLERFKKDLEKKKKLLTSK